MTKTLGSFELPLYCSQQHRNWAVYGRPYHWTDWSGNKINIHLLRICDFWLLVVFGDVWELLCIEWKKQSKRSWSYPVEVLGYYSDQTQGRGFDRSHQWSGFRFLLDGSASWMKWGVGLLVVGLDPATAVGETTQSVGMGHCVILRLICAMECNAFLREWWCRRVAWGVLGCLGLFLVARVASIAAIQYCWVSKSASSSLSRSNSRREWLSAGIDDGLHCIRSIWTAASVHSFNCTR